MASSTVQPVHADAVLTRWLTDMGLGVEYTRAEGDTLYHLADDGTETAVLDLACGFGSLIFGHHHPELVAHAKAVLDSGFPVHAQLSLQPHAARIGAELNRIIQRETGSADHYTAVFANSGAEAVEISMKHAELERRGRISALLEEIAEHVEQARVAVGAGRAVLAPDLSHDVDDVVREVERWNAERLALSPVFLTLEGAFHGKLVGSVQLTQNESWRSPFASLAPSARFLPVDRPEVLAKTVEEVRENVLDVVVEDGVVRLVTRDFPVVGAIFVEPIRGGAGMRPVTRELAEEIAKLGEALGCPVVVDEVQSGMGRSGAFLASSHMGLRGDYYTLAKSIGGGIAKSSVVLIRQDRFRPVFEVIHSSTFAKDGFSGAIALKVLEMLEADGGAAYRKAADLGARLLGVLEGVRDDFPEVVSGVHGIGLMLALEVHEQTASPAAEIREPAEAGVLGYVLAGYLLREHRIRVLPAGPAWNSVRFEPSINLTDEDVARIDTALRALCTILRDADGGRLR
ncbi:aminotransferase class III-fold pyridoxal phosphate-dependent enzyme [Actinosynnema sp. NPDC023587]|uniref:aspartate aminotransferase family protein n=1 Tax=Actinosynnema sp. NPDC023587 TaxID=3154695 RepID=UPI0033D28F9B